MNSIILLKVFELQLGKPLLAEHAKKLLEKMTLLRNSLSQKEPSEKVGRLLSKLDKLIARLSWAKLAYGEVEDDLTFEMRQFRAVKNYLCGKDYFSHEDSVLAFYSLNELSTFASSKLMANASTKKKAELQELAQSIIQRLCECETQLWDVGKKPDVSEAELLLSNLLTVMMSPLIENKVSEEMMTLFALIRNKVPEAYDFLEENLVRASEYPGNPELLEMLRKVKAQVAV